MYLYLHRWHKENQKSKLNVTFVRTWPAHDTDITQREVTGSVLTDPHVSTLDVGDVTRDVDCDVETVLWQHFTGVTPNEAGRVLEGVAWSCPDVHADWICEQEQNTGSGARKQVLYTKIK